ncbi:MAG: hypothetical protein JWQ35_1871, partial [Bacteriovoracaceae bacterium]|nr:hypothetical protein [Bacteriovoracaceae bacterium]
ADTHILRNDPTVSSTFLTAALFSLLGHAIKGFLIAGLTRFGWVKLEEKIISENPTSSK